VHSSKYIKSEVSFFRGYIKVASLSAQAAIAIDVQTGAVLYQKNPDEPRAPASVTKLMTALTAREVYFLDQVLETNLSSSTFGTVIAFLSGETQSVRSLIKAALIQSGNDAAEVLAEHYPQGRTGFIEAMNERADKLGMTESHYMNPSGLDEEAHLMSARDVTTLFRAVLDDAFLRETLSSDQTEIIDSTGKVHRMLYNTNHLLWTDYVIAGKTGTTELAGQVLTTLVSIQGQEVIITVMGSEDRYTDTLRLIDAINSSYVWVARSDLDLLH